MQFAKDSWTRICIACASGCLAAGILWGLFVCDYISAWGLVLGLPALLAFVCKIVLPERAWHGVMAAIGIAVILGYWLLVDSGGRLGQMLGSKYSYMKRNHVTWFGVSVQ